MAKKKKRAENGQGTVVKRKDGRYQASFYVADEYGIKKRKSVYGRTEEEAREKMENILEGIEEEKEVWENPSRMKYKQWIERWMADYKYYLKPSTRENYQYMIDGHILSTIGEKPIKRIKTQDIQRLISNKAKVLSPRTVKLIYTIINDSLKQAKYAKVINDNPAENVKLPKQEQKEIKYLNQDDIKKLLEEAKKSKHYTAILFALFTGIRRGELLALEWKHIDFKNNTITIEQALTKTQANGLVIDSPKTKNSKRTITVNEGLMKELKKHSWKQKEYKDKLGDAYYKKHDLVFCKEDGTPLCPVAFSRTFKRLTERAGIEDFSLHGLRHTAATMLLEKGIDLKTVSATLGHAHIGITGDIYAHVTSKMQERAATVLGEVLQECLN